MEVSIQYLRKIEYKYNTMENMNYRNTKNKSRREGKSDYSFKYINRSILKKGDGWIEYVENKRTESN